MPLFLSLKPQTVIYRSHAINNNHAYMIFLFFNVMNTVLHTFNVQTHINVNIECNNKSNDEKQVKKKSTKSRRLSTKCNVMLMLILNNSKRKEGFKWFFAHLTMLLKTFILHKII